MLKNKKLFWQIYPSYLLITIISLGAVTWYGADALGRFYLTRVIDDLEDRAHLIENQIIAYLNRKDEAGLDRFCKEAGKKSSTRITVIAESGRVIADSEKNQALMDNHRDRPEVREALAGRIGTSRRYSQTLKRTMMYLAIPLAGDMGVIRTSMAVTPIDEALGAIQVKIVLGGIIIALITALISLFISRRISRPLEQMKNGAGHFARGNLEYRLPVPESEEMGELARAMNEMASQLDQRIRTIIGQQRELESVLASMEEGVIGVDMEERVLGINPSAARILGCDPSTSKGRTIQEVIRNPVLQRFVAKALSGQEPVQEDILFFSDRERLLNTRGTSLLDAGGNRIGALIVFNDVTELRWLEKVRQDFVANVSHELKTPITAIKGFAETLQESALTDHEAAQRFLGIIQRHVDRLIAIIEDLLTLSRVEKGSELEKMVFQQGRVNDVLKRAIHVCRPLAREKAISVQWSEEEDIWVRMNEALLEQASVNLLNNAIAYSEPGQEVHIEVSRNDVEVTIGFHDQGIGIEKQHLPRIFERFYRVDRGRSRDHGGTGLGLAIVKHIVEAHGGHVTVESTPGKGSTFRIHLPRG